MMAVMDVYLDYAAATPVDEQVLVTMKPFFSENFYNPSALYEPARKASKALQSARAKLAQALGVKVSEIVFTAGASEANNLAVHGVMQAHPYTSLAVSAIEHDSVRLPAKRYKHSVIKVGRDGLVDPANIIRAITGSTVLVSVIYASNEVGTIQPLRKIAAEISELRNIRQKKGNKLPLIFHTDAAQAGNYLDLHVHRLGVDMMTISGGKLYGPKQAGALYVRSGIDLSPLIEGGGQERGMRSGTENIAAAAGLAEALVLAQKKRKYEADRLTELKKYFLVGLKEAAPNCVLNGALKPSLPNLINTTFPGRDNERLLIELDNKGIYAAAGSACSASSRETSHVLKAMGRADSEIRSTVRFSMGRGTDQPQIDRTMRTLAQILAKG